MENDQQNPSCKATHVTESRDCIDVCNLSAAYNSHKKAPSILHEVSFSVKRGTIFGIIGGSGSGKSTLAKVLTGLMLPVDGCVRFDGQTLESKSHRKQLRNWHKLVQPVFQNPHGALNERLTVEELVSEVAVYRDHKSSVEGRKLAKKALERVGMATAYLKSYPYELSGGQAQRIVIARHLMANPKVLVADEPISALDVSVRGQILRLFIQLVNEGMTLIIISHDLYTIRLIADRIAVLQTGKIVEIADTETLYRFPCHPYTQKLLASM